jgi:hypothetical protein
MLISNPLKCLKKCTKNKFDEHGKSEKVNISVTFLLITFLVRFLITI